MRSVCSIATAIIEALFNLSICASKRNVYWVTWDRVVTQTRWRRSNAAVGTPLHVLWFPLSLRFSFAHWLSLTFWNMNKIKTVTQLSTCLGLRTKTMPCKYLSTKTLRVPTRTIETIKRDRRCRFGSIHWEQRYWRHASSIQDSCGARRRYEENEAEVL